MLLVFFLMCCCMYCAEKKGKPIFTPVVSPVPPKAKAQAAEARRRRSESVGGFAGDSDDGFGTDAEGGFETSDDESDGTPRRDAADDRDPGGFADFADDQEGGLHSYRALVTGRIGRDDA